jgi:hypothetical protein
MFKAVWHGKNKPVAVTVAGPSLYVCEGMEGLGSSAGCEATRDVESEEGQETNLKIFLDDGEVKEVGATVPRDESVSAAPWRCQR